MTAYEKPMLTVDEVEALLRSQFGFAAAGLTPMEGGNLSRVFAFDHAGQGYVVKFSDLDGAYETERYISDLLAGQGIPFPKCIGTGKTGPLAYAVMERIKGRNLGDCPMEQQTAQLPELIELLTRVNQVDVGSTSGYGWIGADGNGAYSSWKDFVTAFNAEDQTGTFWENWHELFRTSCLERGVFEECYNRLLAYLPYNEPHRHFIHGDFHQWNILSDGSRITGIIDGNCLYGDFLVDLAILDRHMPWQGIVERYERRQAELGIEIPSFKERLIGAYYYKGLDGLRFYAKMGMTDAYNGTREFLLGLPA